MISPAVLPPLPLFGTPFPSVRVTYSYRSDPPEALLPEFAFALIEVLPAKLLAPHEIADVLHVLRDLSLGSPRPELLPRGARNPSPVEFPADGAE